MPVHGDTRACVRVAPEKQQQRRGKQAHQGTRRSRRHVSGLRVTNYSNVRGSAPAIKRHAIDSNAHARPGFVKSVRQRRSYDVTTAIARVSPWAASSDTDGDLS